MGIDNYSEPENRTGAIPEAQKTKKDILELKREARQALGLLQRHYTYDTFNQFRSKIVELYFEVSPHIMELDSQGKYESLDKIVSRDFKRNKNGK